MTTPNSIKAALVKLYLQRIAKSKAPIVVGPFRSEVGFEVLYWMPFVKWALGYAGIDPNRCVALSRGGMGKLYGVAHDADLYKLRGVDAVRFENTADYERRKLQKQTEITPWDVDVSREAAKGAFGPSRSLHILHPSWMYWLLDAYWNEQASVQWAAQFLPYGPLPIPSLPEGVTLPKKFIAVRLYERATFPMTRDVQAVMAEFIQQLAAREPIVVLRTKHHTDDHIDFGLSGTNIHQIPDVQPEQNLLFQGAILARASAFVGTYGGVAQWALRYGKPSYSLFVKFQGTALAHWHLSQLLAAKMDVPFQVMDLRLMGLWSRSMLGSTKAAEKVGA